MQVVRKRSWGRGKAGRQAQLEHWLTSSSSRVLLFCQLPFPPELTTALKRIEDPPPPPPLPPHTKEQCGKRGGARGEDWSKKLWLTYKLASSQSVPSVGRPSKTPVRFWGTPDIYFRLWTTHSSLGYLVPTDRTTVCSTSVSPEPSLHSRNS